MRIIAAPLTLLAILSTACSDQSESLPPASENSTDGQAEMVNEQIGFATLRDADGQEFGTASLSKVGEILSVALSITDGTAGEHALHLHTTGLCEGPDFKSAGGHLNPSGKTHGHLSSDGKHLGDLPNINIGSDGTLEETIEMTWAGPSSIDAIFDEDGTAIMIHAGPDDYKSDPAGDAGSRIACGVVQAASDTET